MGNSEFIGDYRKQRKAWPFHGPRLALHYVRRSARARDPKKCCSAQQSADALRSTQTERRHGVRPLATDDAEGSGPPDLADERMSRPAGAFVQVPLAQPSELLFASAAELALSVEPTGSTPLQPGEPFAYRGLCGKMWRVKALT